MSGEPPIEFRAAKPGLTVADWLAFQLRHDGTIYAGAAALAMFGALVAGLVSLGFVWFVLWVGPFWVGGWIALLLALVAVTGLFLLQRRYDGDHTEPVKVDAGTRGRITLRLSRLTGNSWLMFLDRPSGDLHPAVRFVLNLFLLAPRLFALGRQMWRRSQRVKTLDLEGVAAALDALMQAGNRVAIGDLIQEFPDRDPQRLLGDLTSLDGVILLSSEPPGLTLAPSVAEDYEAWKKETRKKRRAAGY
jgi:hypothetical protein